MRVSSTKNTGINSVKMLIYGSAGSGKTTLASTIPEKTLIISAEAGLLSIKGHDIDVIDITTDDDGNPVAKEDRITRVGQAYKYLLTGEARAKYKWVFIDSITEISQNMIEALQKEFPDRKDSLVLYGENSKRMRAMIKLFRDLPYYNIVFTALAEEEKDESGRRYQSISVVGKMSQQIAGYLDEVFYLSCIEDDEKGLTRQLVTQPTSRLVCKDRSGKLNRFEQPNLGLIAEKIRSI